MHTLKMIGNFLGRGLFREMRLRKIKLKRERQLAERKEKKIEDLRRVRSQIETYPYERMTAVDFAAVKRQIDIDLHTCPLGTWFVYPPHPAFPDVVVLGQVVDSLHMIAKQWGSGLSLPPRGVNRYRLQLV